MIYIFSIIHSLALVVGFRSKVVIRSRAAVVIAIAATVRSHVFRDGSLDGFRIGPVDDIDLLAVLEIVEGGNRSHALSLHQFGGIWGCVSNDLQEDRVRVFVAELVELRGDDFAGPAPGRRIVHHDERTSGAFYGFVERIFAANVYNGH